MERFFKSIISMVFLVLLTLTLGACNGFTFPTATTTSTTSGDEKVVPVYQGMIVSESLTNLSSVNGWNDSFIQLGYSGGWSRELRDNPIDQNDPFGDSDIGTIADLIASEYVVTPIESADYYSQIEKDIYITVKLSNPDNFVILSFTLNGVFYQSYQFQEGSDSENLILKINTGSTQGIKEYTIDAIKYIEGTDIKDAIFAGDRTVTVGLAYSSSPSVAISNEVINATSMILDIDFSDSWSLSTMNKVVLYDGTELVQTYDLVVGNNSITFDKLNINTLYQFAVLSIFDILDGQNARLEILEKKAFYTDDIVAINDVNPTQTSIGFGITVTDVDQVGAVSAIELYQGEALIEALVDLDVREFSGLLSDNEYTIKVTYTYDLNDGVGPQTLIVQKTISTIAKVVPTVVIDNVISTQTSIEFGITITDVDQVGTVSAIELFKDETLVEALSDLNVREFVGLLSNNEYTIKITYSFDLDDGVDSQTLIVQQAVTTVAKVVPIIVIDNVVPTQSSIGFGLSVTDVDQVGGVTAIELYKGETLVEALADLNVREFTGLLSNNEYTVKVTFIYDLDDGVDSQTLIVQQAVTTIAKVIPAVAIDNVVPTQSVIGFGITVTDVDQVGVVTAIELYKGETLIETLTDLNVREFTGLLSNNEYTVKVTYTYDLNSGSGANDIIVSSTSQTDIYLVPSLILSDIYPQQSTISFSLEEQDTYDLGSIESIKLFKDDLLVENLFDFENLLFGGLEQNSPYSIVVEYEYDLNDGNGKHVEKYQNEVSTTIFDGDGTEISPYLLRTPEDLSNIRYYTSAFYLVLNNINLTSFEWSVIPEFRGMLDGNGNTIQHFQMTVEDVRAASYFGLFAINFGTIQNAYFTDVHFDFQGISPIITGVVAGQNQGTINNVHVVAEMSVDSLSTIRVGGLVGENFNGTLSSVSSDLIVYAISNGSLYVGGLVGFIDQGSITQSSSKVLIDSHSYSNSQIFAGGLVGFSRSIVIEAVYATGTINTITDESMTIGGLIGGMELQWGGFATITEGYSNVELNMVHPSNGSLGGIIGWVNLYPGTTAILENLFALGAMESLLDQVPMGHLVGSLWGEGDLILLNCFKLTTQLFVTPSSAIVPTDETMLGTVQVTIEELSEPSFYVDHLSWSSEHWFFTHVDPSLQMYPVLSDPLITIHLTEVSQDQISFHFVFTDETQGNISAIELFQGETLVESLTDLNIREFTGLLSNHEYTIKVTYTYNLDDGFGTQTLVVQKTVSTLTNEVPTIGFGDLLPTPESIGFGVTVTDVDQVGAITAIELYLGETLIESLNDLNERQFLGLLSNKEYTIKVTYTYDLNAGNGSCIITKNEKIFTLPTGLFYQIIDGKAIITSYTGLSDNIILPDTVGDYPISQIAVDAFRDNATLESVVLGKYVVSVGNNAFRNMANLKTISLPASLMTFGTYVFFGDNKLEKLTISGEATLELKYFFGGNIADIPASLIQITFAPNSAFIDMTLLNGNIKNVDTIVFPEGMTSILHDQFRNNPNLKTIILPSTLVEIQTYAFNGCTNLTTVIFNEGLKDILSYAFGSCPNLTGIVFPETLSSIQWAAFEYCYALTDVVIPASVTRIDLYAFSQCWDLTFYPRVSSRLVGWNGEWNASLPIVWNYQGKGISSVITYDSNGGTSLDSETRLDTISLLDLPSPIQEGFVFSGWYMDPELTQVLTLTQMPENGLSLYAKWTLREYSVTFVDFDGTVLSSQRVFFESNAIAPISPTRTGYTFYVWNRPFTNVKTDLMIKAVYTINHYALTFDTDGGLAVATISGINFGSSTTLPIPVKEGFVFLRWENGGIVFTSTNPVLNDVTLTAIWTPAISYVLSFDTAGGNAIDSINVIGFTEVKTLPISTRTDYLFDGWYLGVDLVETPFLFNFEENRTLTARWVLVGDQLTYSIVGDTITITGYVGSKTSYTLPDSINGYRVTSIAADAFRNNTTLESLFIGEYVTTIGNYAFSGMTNLKQISLPTATKTLGTNVFYGSNSLEMIILSSEMAYELRYLFGNNISFVPASLTKIKYANGATFIDKTLVLANMKNATTLILADDLTEIVDYQFYQAIYLENVILPEGLTRIGLGAFAEAISLTSITIPDSVTVIAGHAFRDTSIANVEISKDSQLTYIGEHAFIRDPLKYVFIPKGVVTIGIDAFTSDNVVIFAEAGSFPVGWAENFKLEWCPVIWGYLETRDDGLLRYAITSFGTAFILGQSLTSTETDIYIPAFLDGYVIEQIVYQAFKDNQTIQSIYIPNTITKMGWQAFMNATGLTTVTFEEFSQVDRISNALFYNATSLTSINLPDAVTIIEAWSFKNTSLEDIILPLGLSKIEWEAFSMDNLLTSIIIPINVEFIGQYAFYGTGTMTIFAEANEKPAGWDVNFKPSWYTVVWGHNPF